MPNQGFTARQQLARQEDNEASTNMEPQSLDSNYNNYNNCLLQQNTIKYTTCFKNRNDKKHFINDN